MRDEVVKALLEKVKHDYSTISKRFDATRQEPWEEFNFFSAYLEPGQKLLDVGCGNGRLAAFFFCGKPPLPLRGPSPTSSPSTAKAVSGFAPLPSGSLWFDRKDTRYGSCLAHETQAPAVPFKIKYLGIDNNEELIAIARKRHPYAKFEIADQTSLPFADESFNHTWNIAAFHHVPSKKLRLQALKEMRRVLKKDGLLILTVWNLWQKKYRKYTVKSILRNLLFGEYEYNDTFIPWGKEKLVMRYYHAFRPGELRDLLKKASFDLIDEFYTKKGKRVKFSESYNLCFVARPI